MCCEKGQTEDGGTELLILRADVEWTQDIPLRPADGHIRMLLVRVVISWCVVVCGQVLLSIMLLSNITTLANTTHLLAHIAH